MMSPLRIPNISRNGRDQCRRRVKCDEQDLPCSNCMSPELDCTYLKGMACNAASSRPQSHAVPISCSKSGSSPWQGGVNSPESKHSCSRQVNDMELIHKYSTETYRSLSANDSENSIWQITVPSLALQHKYLMNGILALASMHIATSSETCEASVYLNTGLKYYDQSLALFRDELNDITPQNCNAIFANSIVTVAVTVASSLLMDTNGEHSSKTDNAVILVGLLQGVKMVLQTGRPWINLELFPHDECWDNAVAELDVDTSTALAHLATLNDEIMIGIFAEQHRTNKKLISHLRHCYAEFARSAGLGPVLAWLAAVEEDFVKSLRCREPFSLLILMYWGVLLGELDEQRWWARDSGRALVSELLEALSSDDPSLEHAFAWIRRKMSL
ncbi:hypothetical protein HAV15_011212 [Penicillium sp. str. |nr:hypothetical protein HAV15_011212 [Penicillium sp. str. \